MSQEVKGKKHKCRKKSNKIFFETEIVTKDIAEQTLHDQESNSLTTPKIATKLDKHIPTFENVSTTTKSKNKKAIKSGEQSNKIEDQKDDIATNEAEDDTTKPEVQKGDSKRAKKRKKHELLLTEKRIKGDCETRDKCLNYLSKWKHSHDEWKFEKKRQVWLQQNMLDSEKMPDNCWETLLEYFENSKGNVRQKIIEESLKLIEQNEQDHEKDDVQKDKSSTLKRARDVIQYLQT